METANPNASENAKKLLNWLEDLPKRDDRRVVVGQHVPCRWGTFARDYDHYLTGLNESTGLWPGMLGTDYGHGISAETIAEVNAYLIGWWEAGGLIEIDYQAPNPWSGETAWDLTDRNLIELIDPAEPVHIAWMAELDKVAAGLAELRDVGAIILWRPFPQMTYRECFWWDSGAHPSDPEPYKDLWRFMFDYFTHEKDLDNILWVYAPANTDNWSPVEALYPGAGYVDVVGIDEYGDRIAFKGDGYNKLVALGKVFALTETGPLATRDGSWNNMNLINAIRDSYPDIVYCHYWHSWKDNAVAIVDNQNAEALLNDPWVITRDQIDWREIETMADITEDLESVVTELEAVGADVAGLVATLNELQTRLDAATVKLADTTARLAAIDQQLDAISLDV